MCFLFSSFLSIADDQAVQNADTVTSLRHCPNCFDNVAKHLIISFGKHVTTTSAPPPLYVYSYQL